MVREGRQFLTAYPKDSGRVAVAMLLADSLARQGHVDEELALYDGLLKDLGASARGVPLAEETDGTNPIIRSPHYQQVLDRYLARLSELKRPLDALRVYRREIDRNPSDPGLYRRFASYLDNNRLGTQLIQTYQRAMAKFPGQGWEDDLARWYLRGKRTADFERLTREITDTFAGTELDQYFGHVVASAKIDDSLYLALNKYAHQRFPEDLEFVRNLMGAYQREDIRDYAAYTELIREYWFYDDGLKRQFFQDLSSSGQLAAELVSVRGTNLAEVQCLAEGEAWLSHFEEAAPHFRKIAETNPGDVGENTRAASIYRSLAAYDQANTEVAVNLQRQAVGFVPRNRDLLETVGDIYADRDQLDKSRPVWNAVLRIEPGNTESYLSAATVFWDYYLYDDALRVIADGRRKLGNPTLFAYEAGAIDEGKRDYGDAIRQYVAGAQAGDDSARSRLIRLAKRKTTGPLVEQATAALGTEPAAARNLRIAVLEVGDRRNDLQAFLATALQSAKRPQVAVDIAEAAKRDGFDSLEEQATEKQTVLTTDPVDRMQSEINLARFYEAHQRVDKAQQTIDALYRANPKILGVVRATVDFENRVHQPDRAIATLLDAAKNARLDLANQFTLEAARTATTAGEFDRTRTILAGLLKADPYNAAYLDVMADTFAQAKDNAGYQRYVLATIKSLQASPLPAADKVDRVAALRRGLIPVLTRQSEFAQAVDQYIEILNRYPEDESLAREAAGYAMDHGRFEQLVSFYRTTIEKAPRDYRWPIVLARIETRGEDYPAAIAAYGRAMTDRPDRADIVGARGILEERLLRFEVALKTYAKLYQLTYHDPQWMQKTAELNARLGHVDEAVKALHTAVVGDYKQTAPMLFEIADQLDKWNMTPQAEEFAESGAKLSGDQLFAIEPADPSLPVYARLMARRRHLDRLLQRMKPESEAGVSAAARVVATEFTPEEKAGIEPILSAYGWLSFAQQAGMAPLEAKIQSARLLSPNPSAETISRLYTLQVRRGEFEAIGKQLEEFGRTNADPGTREIAENDAASAFVAVNNESNAMPILRSLLETHSAHAPLQDWLLSRLTRSYPDRLVQLAGSRDAGLAYQAAQYGIANGSAALALRTVAARSANENPLWDYAFSALTGLYFADSANAIRANFAEALGSDADIGTRVRIPVNRERQLTGSVWFYYAARFGEYLDLSRPADAAAFLPASLEQAAGNPEAYMQLGRFYEEKNQNDLAIARFRNVLQLNADRADAHDQIALTLWKQGKKAEAIAEWRAAIRTFQQVQSRGVAVPQTFWTESEETISDMGKSGVLQQLQPEVEPWLRDYMRRNGSYRLEPLLDAALNATLDERGDVQWVLRIAAHSPDQQTIGSLAGNRRLLPEQRIQLQRQRLRFIARQTASNYGDQHTYLLGQMETARVGLIELLLDNDGVKAAQTEWGQFSAEQKQQNPVTEIRLAAFDGSLPALLKGYHDQPDRAPALRDLQNAVQTLSARPEDALTVSEFLYTRELDQQHLDPANFLGLADVYLRRKQAPRAVALLRRMNLVAGEPFETFVAAADVLEMYGYRQEAIPFLRDRLRAVPWDEDARLKLGQILSGAERTKMLNRVVDDAHAPYATRASAAEALAPHAASNVPPGSELAALSAGPIGSQNAEKPYWAAARLIAARTASGETAVRLSQGALALQPDDASTRASAVKAALDAKQEFLALALADASNTNQASTNQANEPWRRPPEFPWLSRAGLNNAEQANLNEQLSLAAERADDIQKAIEYEQAAQDLRQAGKKTPPEDPRLRALQAEELRRQENAARQPVVGPSIEQKNIVRPKLSQAQVTG